MLKKELPVVFIDKYRLAVSAEKPELVLIVLSHSVIAVQMIGINACQYRKAQAGHEAVERDIGVVNLPAGHLHHNVKRGLSSFPVPFLKLLKHTEG